MITWSRRIWYLIYNCVVVHVEWLLRVKTRAYQNFGVVAGDQYVAYKSRTRVYLRYFLTILILCFFYCLHVFKVPDHKSRFWHLVAFEKEIQRVERENRRRTRLRKQEMDDYQETLLPSLNNQQWVNNNQVPLHGAGRFQPLKATPKYLTLGEYDAPDPLFQDRAAIRPPPI